VLLDNLFDVGMEFVIVWKYTLSVMKRFFRQSGGLTTTEGGRSRIIIGLGLLRFWQNTKPLLNVSVGGSTKPQIGGR
jgi:hypothetical protein